MKVAICVGHSRRKRGRIEGGAVSLGGISEHEFNSDIAVRLRAKLSSYGIQSEVFDDYPGSGYTAAMQHLASDIRKYGADIAIELHFNDADSNDANGYEYLCWHTSTKGRRLATIFLSEHGRKFPSRKARGVVRIDSEKKKGGGFLRHTHCPAVICEPFFGRNPAEWLAYNKNRDALADVYADAIRKYFE